jgi:hypothetical protein
MSICAPLAMLVGNKNKIGEQYKVKSYNELILYTSYL